MLTKSVFSSAILGLNKSFGIKQNHFAITEKEIHEQQLFSLLLTIWCFSLRKCVKGFDLWGLNHFYLDKNFNPMSFVCMKDPSTLHHKISYVALWLTSFNVVTLSMLSNRAVASSNTTWISDGLDFPESKIFEKFISSKPVKP